MIAGVAGYTNLGLRSLGSLRSLGMTKTLLRSLGMTYTLLRSIGMTVTVLR